MTKAISPITHCIVCGNAQYVPIHRVLLRCARCGHTVAATFPREEELGDMYGGAYFTGEEYLDYEGARAVFEKNFVRRLTHIRRYAPHGKLVEVGCAHGFFLSLARSSFMVRGFDISKEAVAYGRARLKLDLTTHVFLKEQIPSESIDVVCMWDTLEHLPRPDQYVARSAGILRRGGVLAITTGDIESFLAKLQGARWRLIHPPTHLHYFSKKTLQLLLARYGFHVVECGYESIWRSLGQITYGLFSSRPSPLARVDRWIRTTPLARLGIPMNTFDNLFVIAKRT